MHRMRSFTVFVVPQVLQDNINIASLRLSLALIYLRVQPTPVNALQFTPGWYDPIQ